MGAQFTYQTYYGSYSTGTEISPILFNSLISNGQPWISSTGNGFDALLEFNKGFFSMGGAFSTSWSGTGGNFRDTIFDRFIGLKFKDGGSTYYGWARVSVAAELGAQSLTVFDYAYEDSGDPIYAGDGIVSKGALSIHHLQSQSGSQPLCC